MKTAIIYALCEPGTRTIRYIGMTTKGVAHRLRQHGRTSAKLKNHLGNWLRSLRGISPAIVPLSEVSIECWAGEEIRYIKAARCLGFDLVNSTDGGDGFLNLSEQANHKRRLALRGRKFSLEHRENMRLAGKTKVFSDEHRRRLCEALGGDKNPNAGKIGPESGRWGQKNKSATSSFRGVFWCARDKRWRARLRVEKKHVYVGQFLTELEAARAYDAAAKQQFGALAKLNFQE